VIHADAANRQHYELPPQFFRTVLGPHLKYSCCWWPKGVSTLEEAERRSLEVTCRRAGIEDGMRVLDLGCGWGSMSLWVAQHYPASQVLAVSNSRLQAEFIRGRCRDLGLSNLEVMTANVGHLDLDRRFDRVVSVEMFEHLRNWSLAFERVAGWLEPDGQMLLHVFCNRHHAYPYEARSASDWMSEHFFTGGMMPSDDLPLRFSDHLRVASHWRWNGNHYSRTLEAWLERQDRQRDQLMPLFRQTYGGDAERWFRRWRFFFLACSELFAFRGGNEWFVSQYRLERRPALARPRPAAVVRPVAWAS
jgi:cyclopropane-fatty-acyl-phospholipid synthase